MTLVKNSWLFFLDRKKSLSEADWGRSLWHIKVLLSNNFLSFETFSVGSTLWPTFSMVPLIWNVIIFDWITSRLAGSASSSAAFRVPLYILSSFINTHAHMTAGKLTVGLSYSDCLKNINLYLNLFINLPPMPFGVHWHVIILVPLPAGIADGVKKIFHVPSMYHSRRGKMTVKEYQWGWGDNCCAAASLAPPFFSPSSNSIHSSLCKCHCVAL